MYEDITQQLIAARVIVDGKLRPRKLMAWCLRSDNTELLISVTKFLPHTATIHERAFNVTNNITSIITCAVCDNTVTFVNGAKGYRPTCSRVCGLKNPATQVKRSETVETRYGVSHYSKTTQFKQTYMTTCMDRYGVSNVKTLPNVRDKVKQTMLARHGGETTLQSPTLMQRVKTTMLDIHGVDHPMKVAAILQRRSDTNLSIYGHTCPLMNEDVRILSNATNMVKYGTIHPIQSDIVKRRSVTTNQMRYDRDHWTQEHISDVTLHSINDIEWLTHQHHVLLKPITLIAEQLGDITTSAVASKFAEHGVEVKHHKLSSLELKLHSWLIDNQLEFTYNNRSIIPPTELDVVLCDIPIAIEVNGLYWHSTIQPHVDVYYHQRKMINSYEQGIGLITTFEDQYSSGDVWNILDDFLQGDIELPTPDENGNVTFDGTRMHIAMYFKHRGYKIIHISDPQIYCQDPYLVYDCGQVTMSPREDAHAN